MPKLSMNNLHERSRSRRWLAAGVGSLLLAGASMLAAQDNGDPGQNYGTSQNQAVADPAAYDAEGAQPDPPSRVTRLSVLLGNVSMEPASVDQFSAAEVNYPLTTGDRVYADVASNAELQTGQLAVRLGQQTDLTVTAMTDGLAQFGLAQGSVHLRAFGLDPGETVELDTPNVAVTMLSPGDVRVDVDPGSDTTVVSLLTGSAQVDGNGLEQVLEPGQRVRLAGSNPVAAQWLYNARLDGLDRFSSDRDGVYLSSVTEDSPYVNPGTIGAEDLASNGDWLLDADYGEVWYPNDLPPDWQPYSHGHWAWIAPWGWTWVDAAPWGFAPFHYGRWCHRGDRWGWVPGPPVVRPVYSPALVVFVGGGPVGGGVTAWFPLAPREPYQPWYHASPLYLNRVNVSNIGNRNTVEVRNIYNQHTTNVYVNSTTVNRIYVNRPVATVAISQASFAAGRPVSQNAVRLSPGQLASAPVLAHPAVTPTRAIVTQAPARALPVHVARPTLASHVDTAVRPTGGQAPRGFGQGQSGAVNAVRPQPVIRGVPLAGGVAGQPAAPVQRPPLGIPTRPGGPVTPSTSLRSVEPTEPVTPMRPSGPTPGSAVHAAGPEIVTTPVHVGPAPGGSANRSAILGERTPVTEQPSPERGQTAAPAVQRPLYNKAVPPPSRPSFEEQQKAIESTEPGRPLSPKQMEDLRQGQPVQPQPRAKEPNAPKPAAAAKPAATADKKH